MIPLNYCLILSAALFCIGIYGVLVRRNTIGVLMSIELILNAANINLVAFSKYLGDGNFLGEIFALFVVAIAAAGGVVGLVLVITIHRNGKSIFVDDFKLMKG